MQITKLQQLKKKTCGKVYLVWRSCKDLKMKEKKLISLLGFYDIQEDASGYN